MNLIAETQKGMPTNGNGRKLRVLIVEDSMTSAFIMESTITYVKPSWDVKICGDIECAKREILATPIHVIMLDIHLPDATPEEVLECIKWFKNHGAKVMVMTGDHNLVDAAMQAGADAFYEKAPGKDAKTFLERIEEMVPTNA